MEGEGGSKGDQSHRFKLHKGTIFQYIFCKDQNHSPQKDEIKIHNFWTALFIIIKGLVRDSTLEEH